LNLVFDSKVAFIKGRLIAGSSTWIRADLAERFGSMPNRTLRLENDRYPPRHCDQFARRQAPTLGPNVGVTPPADADGDCM
jgi:hypothetical protein